MNISYLSTDSGGLIKITADEITSFIDNIDDYTALQLVGNVSCGTAVDSGNVSTTDILDDTKNIYIVVEDEALYIKPAYFGLSSITDNIYYALIKLRTTGGYVQISNCAFLDVTYKCKVGSLLGELLNENSVGYTDKPSTITHLLHYALVNGSNCGCNCDELCKVFTELTNILTIDFNNKDCNCE